jgi:hypothetical protein
MTTTAPKGMPRASAVPAESSGFCRASAASGPDAGDRRDGEDGQADQHNAAR